MTGAARLASSCLALLTLATACTRPGPDAEALRYIDRHGVLNDPSALPVEGIPGGKLVKSLARLEELKLFGRVLSVNESSLPWSSSYFPTWYGGVAGRWQDNLVLLSLRSLRGQSMIEEEEARTLLGTNPASTRGLAPTEKYDLAVGDYQFHSTAFEARERGHNTPSIFGTTPFWAGYCNGVAESAVRHREPFREVDVINPDGQRVRFHPNDVKALLALAYIRSGHGVWVLGYRCNYLKTSTEACKDVNAGTFVIALLNRIGLARESFVIDKEPLLPVINVGVSDARVDITRPPYDPPKGTRAAKLVDVRMEIGASSTQLGYGDANVADETPGVFKKVGLRRERLTYSATLALDARGDIIGGAWSAPEMHGPDMVWGVKPDHEGVLHTEQRLWFNAFVRWDVIRKLHEKSVSDEPGVPVLDVGSLVARDEVYAFWERSEEVKLRKGAPAHFYGYLTGPTLRELDLIVAHAGPAKIDTPKDVYVASYKPTEEEKKRPRLVFRVPVDIPDTADTIYLKAKLLRRGPDGTPQPWREITTILFPRASDPASP